MVDARLSTLERKLDFLEASLENCDPSKRQAKQIQFKGSIFDPEIREKLIASNEQKRQQNQRLFTKTVVAPNESMKNRPIVNTGTTQSRNNQQPKAQPRAQPSAQPKAQPRAQPKSQPKAQQPKSQQPPRTQPVKQAAPKAAAVKKQAPKQPSVASVPPPNPVAVKKPSPSPASQPPPPNPMQNKKAAPVQKQQQPPPVPGGPPKPPSVPGGGGGGPGAGPPPPNPMANKPPPNPAKQQQQPPPSPVPVVKKPPSAPGASAPAPPNPGGSKPPPVPGADGPGAVPPPAPGASKPPPGAGPGAAPPPAPNNKNKESSWPNKGGNQIDILTLKEGDGAIPGGQSAVEIEYTGHLPSGKQFIKHREVIQLGKKQNIKGLEQAVTRIKVGSMIKLWIPARLAYGARGAGNLIPPNADLTFQLQLHRIVKQ